MERSKLFDKIQKLMNLSASPNPHEAASALAMAQKLMAENNIGKLDLSSSQLGHVKVKSAFSTSRIKDFELDLAYTVAGAFGCHVIWMAGNSNALLNEDTWGKFMFIGGASEVPVVEHLFIVLQRKMTKGRADFLNGLGPLTRQRKTLEGDGYCKGYARTVAAAVAKVASRAPKEVVDHYLESTLNIRMGASAKVQARRAGDEGYGAGALAGSKEQLHRPMTTKAHKQIG